METSGDVGGQQAVLATDAPERLTISHAPLRGAFPFKLEASGRVVLPAGLRHAFTDAAVIRASRTDCLHLWNPASMPVVIADMKRENPGMLNPRTMRRFNISCFDVSVDRQSRFVIPADLRDRVDLGERIVLAGALDRVEIWSAEAFEAEQATFDEADLLLDGLDGTEGLQ